MTETCKEISHWRCIHLKWIYPNKDKGIFCYKCDKCKIEPKLIPRKKNE